MIHQKPPYLIPRPPPSVASSKVAHLNYVFAVEKRKGKVGEEADQEEQQEERHLTINSGTR